jgi:hypothetical protein
MSPQSIPPKPDPIREAQQWFALAKRHGASLDTQEKLAADVAKAINDDVADWKRNFAKLRYEMQGYPCPPHK